LWYNKNIMQKNNCQNCKNEFIIEPDDFVFYDKIKVPPPTFCPECRMQRRMAFRNPSNIFKTKNAFTGKDIFSLIPNEANVNVVTNSDWFGDTWDGLDYGVDVDFSRPFLEQVFELHKKTPIVGLNVNNVINSDYSGNANDLKNCYLVFGAGFNEDCMYSVGIHNSKNCLDGLEIYKSENCYGCFNITECNKVYFSEECVQCANVLFSRNCVGCIDCFGCVNLRNKQYFIFNKQYSREDYFKELEKMNLNNYSSFKNWGIQARDFWKQFPKKYIQGIKNVNSSGSYIKNSKNVQKSWIVENGEDLKYVQFVVNQPSKDCYDISVWGYGCELAYEFASSGSGVFNSKFIVDCWPNIRDTEYSLHCSSVSNCFGCSGLRNKEYCILNKKYSKEEYFEMVEKIKKHMMDMPYVDKKGRVYKYGAFFPIEFSWYGYNNTLGQELLPISQNEADENGYPWYEIDKGVYKFNILKGELPENIKECDKEISSKIIECEECGYAYKVLENEFSFLNQNNLPIPRECFNCRHKKRLNQRVGIHLYEQKCMNKDCNEEFLTGYDPKDENIVYCEKCYQQEVS